MNEWGAVAADVAIAVGIAGEVIFGRLDARIQTELRRRSNEQLAKATLLAEQLRADNLALQTVLLPRHIGLIGTNEAAPASRWFNGLGDVKRFGVLKVEIQVVFGDREAANFAAEIHMLLKIMGHHPRIVDDKRTSVASENLSDGVIVMYPVGKSWSEEEPNQPWFRWKDAAELLADGFTEAGLGMGTIRVPRFGFLSSVHHAGRTPLFSPPLEGVYIQVGSRPVAGTVEWIKRGRPDAAGIKAK